MAAYQVVIQLKQQQLDKLYVGQNKENINKEDK